MIYYKADNENLIWKFANDCCFREIEKNDMPSKTENRDRIDIQQPTKYPIPLKSRAGEQGMQYT